MIFCSVLLAPSLFSDSVPAAMVDVVNSVYATSIKAVAPITEITFFIMALLLLTLLKLVGFIGRSAVSTARIDQSQNTKPNIILQSGQRDYNSRIGVFTH
jgi:hypothetical protein